MVVKRIAVVAVLGALGLVPAVSPSQAAGTGTRPGVSAAARVAVAPPLIQGLAVDQNGRYVDDVSVQATDDQGRPAASAITYASGRDDGPQHGYFYLEVGSRGSYTLTLSRNGYATTTYGPVDVTRKKQRIGLGEILVKKVLPATSTAAALDDSSITTGQRGRVDVTVSSRATKKPAGELEIRDGRKVVGSGVLKPGDRGSATITLKKLAAGGHDLKAYFFGSASLKDSASKGFGLTVKKPRHRPNAW